MLCQQKIVPKIIMKEQKGDIKFEPFQTEGFVESYHSQYTFYS